MKLYEHQVEALEEVKDKNRCAVPGYDGLYEIDTSGRVFSVIQNAHRRKGELA